MPLVGIIANPAASKDIRRLVAQGRVVPDWEKVNTLRRVLLGMQSVGVERVTAMPDSSHLVERAADDPQVSIHVELLDMPAYYNEGDTQHAAMLMKEMGVGCLVTLGGDGTNRAAAKGAVTIPMVAISTGTNNVFPAMVEGTLAGIATGLVVDGRLALDKVAQQSKTLSVYLDGQYCDMALVDVAISRERFVATRAIWDVETLYEVFLTRSEPASIGLCSIAAQLQPLSLADERGIHYVIGDPSAPNGTTVSAPVAPGVVSQVPIESWRLVSPGERISLESRHCTVALDGERAFAVTPDQLLELELRRDGPPVVDVRAALTEASLQGLLRT